MTSKPVKKWKYEQEFGPGEYFVGDPGYIFKDQELWMKLLKKTKYFDTSSQMINDTPIFCHSTYGGDGTFECSKTDKKFVVDSGNLGIIPTSLITEIPGMSLAGTKGLGYVAKFPRKFVARADKGVFQFGSKFHINTGPNEARS